jgi:hypothetical protein
MIMEVDLADGLWDCGVLANLGVVAGKEGDHETALALLGEALTMARKRGEPLAVARILLESSEIASAQPAIGGARLTSDQVGPLPPDGLADASRSTLTSRLRATFVSPVRSIRNPSDRWS